MSKKNIRKNGHCAAHKNDFLTECIYCNHLHCEECPMEDCYLCIYTQTKQLKCPTCNGILYMFDKNICYDCFILLIMADKIMYCYSCLEFIYKNDTTIKEHRTCKIECNQKKIHRLAIQKLNLRNAYTLMSRDSDYV